VLPIKPRRAESAHRMNEVVVAGDGGIARLDAKTAECADSSRRSRDVLRDGCAVRRLQEPPGRQTRLTALLENGFAAREKRGYVGHRLSFSIALRFASIRSVAEHRR
jgi:hypothetical protein